VSKRIEVTEPLLVEMADFCGAIRSGGEPVSSHAVGLEVVRMIEAVDRSLAQGSARVLVDGSAPTGDFVAASSQTGRDS
jgi:predicted dehydrogenase